MDDNSISFTEEYHKKLAIFGKSIVACTETDPEKSDTSNNQKSENAKEGLENTKDSAQNTDNKAGIILLSIIIVTITSVIIFMFKQLKKN
jgi:hypothetical protein